jgi:hypothetical protein
MPLAEWGTKRVCPTTGKRFYDLNRSPIVSPYTGEVVDIESARRKMAAAVIARVQPKKTMMRCWSMIWKQTMICWSQASPMMPNSMMSCWKMTPTTPCRWMI